MNCDKCAYTEISDWEQDVYTGKAKAVLWCERYMKFCSDITDCKYEEESEARNEDIYD